MLTELATEAKPLGWLWMTLVNVLDYDFVTRPATCMQPNAPFAIAHIHCLSID